MCGIAGFCNFKEDFEENTDYWNFRLEKMRAVLAHRGNDARGRYLKKHIGLSHSRLAIRSENKKMFYQADYKIFIDKKGRIALLLLHEVR